MPEEPTSCGLVSEDELAGLTFLFRKFEGASDPLSECSQAAKQNFNSLATQIYTSKVRHNFVEIDFSLFISMIRNKCRERISKEDPPFPCA